MSDDRKTPLKHLVCKQAFRGFLCFWWNDCQTPLWLIFWNHQSVQHVQLKQPVPTLRASDTETLSCNLVLHISHKGAPWHQYKMQLTMWDIVTGFFQEKLIYFFNLTWLKFLCLTVSIKLCFFHPVSDRFNKKSNRHVHQLVTQSVPLAWVCDAVGWERVVSRACVEVKNDSMKALKVSYFILDGISATFNVNN